MMTDFFIEYNDFEQILVFAMLFTGILLMFLSFISYRNMVNKIEAEQQEQLEAEEEYRSQFDDRFDDLFY